MSGSVEPHILDDFACSTKFFNFNNTFGELSIYITHFITNLLHKLN